MPLDSHRVHRDADTKLNLSQLTEISRTLVQQYDPTLELLAVTPTEGSNDRAEVLVRIRGCHAEPCSLAINLTRNATAQAFADELASALKEALAAHPAEREP